MKSAYVIVRIDHRTVPAIVEYVTEDNRRFSSFRTSATIYNKRDGTREAKRLIRDCPFWPGQYRVVDVSTSACVFDSAAEVV